MGQCACGGDSQPKYDMDKIIFIQTAIRKFLAKKLVREMVYDDLVKITELRMPHISGTGHGEPLLTEAALKKFIANPDKRFLIKYDQEIGDGMVYNGQWRCVDGQMVRDGIGKLKMKDGGVYEGMFEVNMMTGVGRMTHATGDMYQGEW